MNKVQTAYAKAKAAYQVAAERERAWDDLHMIELDAALADDDKATLDRLAAECETECTASVAWDVVEKAEKELLAWGFQQIKDRNPGLVEQVRLVFETRNITFRRKTVDLCMRLKV